jgi:hypothetical protein
LEVRAKVRRPVKALTRLDFPTLDRPTNAISGNPSGASADGSGAPATKRASAAKSLRPASARVESTARGGTIGENVVPEGPEGIGSE